MKHPTDHSPTGSPPSNPTSSGAAQMNQMPSRTPRNQLTATPTAITAKPMRSTGDRDSSMTVNSCVRIERITMIHVARMTNLGKVVQKDSPRTGFGESPNSSAALDDGMSLTEPLCHPGMAGMYSQRSR